MYQALYRKWRPQTFSDVAGQNHITSTLKNEVKENKLGHAYLFTGTRGTGKTSCAKILAKAANCLKPKDGEPCNKCEICEQINNGSLLDIIEIDAASNNGVDDIRELREEVIYTPAKAGKKVYIIDEVHMLSTGAFNALLKTLEEPPSHIIFIFSTTEIHKIPATILSRCQRFDFRRLTISEITDRLIYICEKENIEYDKEALLTVSRLADGSMRDGLSILDQCAGLGKKLTLEGVLDITGGAGKEHIKELCEAVLKSDISYCLETLSELYKNSKDMARLCDELIAYYRDMLIVKTVNEPQRLLDYTATEIEALAETASKYKLERVLYSINILQDTLNRMQKSANKSVEAEIAFIKLCNMRQADTNEALLARLEELEAKFQSGAFAKQEIKEEPKSGKKQTKPKNEEPQKEEKKTPAHKENIHFWQDVLENLRASNNLLLWSLLKGSTVEADGGVLTIKTENKAAITALSKEENKKQIADTVKGITGTEYRIMAENAQPKAEEGDLFSEWINENKDDIEII